MIFQKIKDKLNSRSPYYYYKYEDSVGALNNDPTFEYWIYSNNNSIYSHKDYQKIICDGTVYHLNTKNKVYFKVENVTSEENENIDLNMFLPGEDYTLKSNSFDLALHFKIEDIDDCYKLTYKDKEYIYSTYIDKDSFDLIKTYSSEKNDEDNSSEKTYEWKLLENETLTQEDVQELIKDYKEGTFEEFKQDIEF